MSEFVPLNRLKSCRYGQMLFNFRDQYIGRSLDLYSEFSEGEVDLFRQLLKPGQTVYEVGANLGAHTLFLAQQVGATGAVWAFEPQRLLFQTLCANMALNHVTNVYCRPEAVGASPGTIRVPPLDYYCENNFGGVSLEAADIGETVPVVTIDGLEPAACHFLKVDVEGMEAQVIKGAQRTIARHRPLLYVENDRPEKSDDLIRLIDACGYAMYWHLPPLFNPNNFAGNPTNVFGQIKSLNMVCLPKELPQPLKSFGPVQVPAAP